MSTRGPVPVSVPAVWAAGPVISPRLGHLGGVLAAEGEGGPDGWRHRRWYRHIQAKRPVQQLGGVDEGHALVGWRAVEYHADQHPLAMGGLEQQALAGRRSPAGLDPDNSRVALEQQVRIEPEVAVVVLRPGVQPVPLAPDLGPEGALAHRRPAELDQVARSRHVGRLQAVEVVKWLRVMCSLRASAFIFLMNLGMPGP